MNKIALSIVIPFYNTADVLGDCLRAIYESDFKDFEVIAVDDNSNDNSAKIVKSFPVKLISHKQNLGAGYCRNEGVKVAEGEIIVFIDSDVIIKKDSLSLVIENYKKLPEISVVQSIYSQECQYDNFVSIYSSLHYHFYGMQIKKEYISSVASYFIAVKKDVFTSIGGFDHDIKTTRLVAEDQLFGYKLNNEGHKIYVDKRILVEHKKSYFLKQYLLHDIQTGHDQIHRFLGSNFFDLIRHISTGEVGALIPTSFVYSMATAFLIFLTALLCLFTASCWVIAFLFAEVMFFYWLNWKFLAFTLEKRGWSFFLRSAVLTYFKMLFAVFGCIKGFVNYGIKKVKKIIGPSS